MRFDSIRIKSIRWDSSWPELVGDDGRQAVFSYVENRFGIPRRRFDAYLLFERGKAIRMLKSTALLEQGANLKIAVAGMKAFHRIRYYIKPTTRFIQVFGEEATRAVIPVRNKDMRKLALGQPMPLRAVMENGYVILVMDGLPLGLGLCIDGHVQSQIPKQDHRFFV
jgi:NOL1/NOP2/fmu family ribosome biogenesis protein